MPRGGPMKRFCVILLGLAFMVLSTAARAATCTVSATPVAFGSYNVFNTTPLDATGTVTVHCTGLGELSYNIKLSTGLSGSYAPRQMANGANRLNYNLYT